MPTTTQIKNIADLLYLGDYAGEFGDDYDWDAINAEYLEAINTATPDGVVVYANGEVIAELDVAEAAHEIDWKELLDDIDVDPIFQRHDLTDDGS